MKQYGIRDVAHIIVRRSLVALSSLLVGATALSAQTDTGSKMSGSMSAMRHDSSDAAVRMLAVVSRDEVDAGKLALTKATRADVKAYAQRMIDDHTKALRQLGDSAKSGGWAMPDSGMWGSSGGMVGNSRGSGSGMGAMGSSGTGSGSGMAGSGTAGSGTTGSGAAGGMSSSGKSDMSRSSNSAMQNGDDAMKLHAANVAAMKKLKDASGAAFDQMYVSTQIEGHSALLKALDQHPASSASQKGLVAELKSTVQSHLDAVRKLQTNSSAMKP